MMIIRRSWTIALLIGWTIFVYVSGPVATALARATSFQLFLDHMDRVEQQAARWNAAQRLLRVFDSRRPVSFEQMHYPVDDGCGYARTKLDWTEQAALDHLSGAEVMYQGQSHSTARLERFVPTLSGFAVVFLDNCITSTVFARACESHVDATLARAGIRSPYEMPATAADRERARMQGDIVCRYRDGVAARAGRALSRLSTQQE